MKRGFLAVLVLCAAMLFGGCREGGSEAFRDEPSVISAEEFNIGERSDKSERYTYSSSSSIASSSSSKRSTVSAESSYPESSKSEAPPSEPVIVVIQSTQPAQTTESTESTESTQSTQSSITEASSQSPPKSSTAPIVITVPEEPSGNPSSAFVVPDNSEPVEDDTSTDIGDVPSKEDSDTSAGISGVTSEPDASSSSLEEPSEPQPETSVSPYEYEGNVYIAASGKGRRYHKTPTCSNMHGVNVLTAQEALKKGYTPCKNCW